MDAGYYNITTMVIRSLTMMIFCCLISCSGIAQEINTTTTGVGLGWANNSINAVIFRKNSLVTFRDTQFIAYYDRDRHVVLGKRQSGAKVWQTRRTDLTGNAADAHNAISIMVDGAGFLHLAWDHHDNPLNYCKSISPGSLELTGRLSMTGSNEQKVAYPEFYTLPGGDLLFFYRNGASGNGSLAINKYSPATRKWVSLQHNLVDGEGQRNAYWQACTDSKGTIHISWVWRETPDVASNHDMCYARSTDGGISWEKSTGEPYKLPITAATAEYICRVPQNSELINQTSMVADEGGKPYIASYWKAAGDSIPQYQVIYHDGTSWNVHNTGFRKTGFSLSGMGTRRIPVSRPQVVAWKKDQRSCVAVIFRDAERFDRVSAAVCNDIATGAWIVKDLAEKRAGAWEPSYDTELWKQKKVLNLFVQEVEQVSAEGLANAKPSMVSVLEWKIAGE